MYGPILLTYENATLRNAALVSQAHVRRIPSTATARPWSQGTYHSGCRRHSGTRRTGIVRRAGLCVGECLR